jgi:hypothetical protein
LAAETRLDEAGGRKPGATVFVADPSSEAEHVALALRAAGHIVVDVPPSMLVARVAVQHPRVVVVDADAEGALDVVERMRELPEADDIHVLFIARPGGALTSPEEALAHEGSGLFVRPVDVSALVQKVQMLAATAATGVTPPRTTHPVPPIVSPLPPRGPSSPPSLPPASMRASVSPVIGDSKSPAPPSPRPPKTLSYPPSAPGSGSGRMVMGLAPPVSDELQQLLAEAEQRVEVKVELESIVPSPEDEIEAVLPADLLDALDEPLYEDEDDDDAVAPSRSASATAGRDRTSIRSGSRGTRTTTTGGGSTTGNTPRSRAGRRPSDPPATPSPGGHTQGGTHAGPTGEGISTTGGSEPGERSDSGARVQGNATRVASGWPVAGGTGAGGTREGATTGGQARESLAPAQASEGFPAVLGPGEAMRVVARAIATRTTGSLCLAAPEDSTPAGALQRGAGVDGTSAALPQRGRHLDTTSAALPQRGRRFIERRIVLREGDVVTTSSTAEDESLLAFLGVRGDLPRETVRRLAPKFPPFGRHAGAALVARGYLRQDHMWSTLRAHAEWLFARILQTASGRLVIEPQPPGRLGGEPSVFGGSTGAGVFVEVVRRIVPPAEAVERLGGVGSRLGHGPEARLLSECALEPAEVEQVQAASGRSIREVLYAAPEADLPTVLFALWQLGVLDVIRTAGEGAADVEDQSDPDVAALDAEAVRERVRARMQLVDDGDYFALLGVPHDATGYEVRRAFLELRRAFDPSRVLTHEVFDLAEDVGKIASVLEEAYEILKDAARRERYRRAIEAVPDR